MESPERLNGRSVNLAVKAMETQAVRSLLDRLAGLDVEIAREPETGLVMMNVRDCFNSEFHLGEVLVTTAEVRIGGERGWGMIMGDESDRALLLACLDVVLRDGSTPIGREIEAELTPWLNRAEGAVSDEQKRAAATRVSFHSMAGQ